MRGLVAGVISLVALAALVAVLAVAAGALPAQDLASTSAVLTDHELEALGLSFQPVPRTANAPIVSISKAIEVAATREDRSDPPVEVLRTMISPDASSPAQSAYVIIWLGGSPFPGGPEGALHRPRISGIVIDDQTGEFLTGFYYAPLSK